MTLKSMHRRRPGCDEGAAAVEAAITLPVLLLLILGIIEYGVALYNWNTMLLAVEQAGRSVMVYHGGFPPGLCNGSLISCAEAQMQNYLGGASRALVCGASGGVVSQPSPGQMCVYASTSGSNMTLAAYYNFNFLRVTYTSNGLGLGAPFTMTSQATFPLD
jgi:hypothetical protein